MRGACCIKAGEGKGQPGEGGRQPSSFARTASTQPVKQASYLKDATVDTVEKIGAKEPDPYEEADDNAAFAASCSRLRSKAARRCRPSAAPRGIGTALPICLAIAALEPTNW